MKRRRPSTLEGYLSELLEILATDLSRHTGSAEHVAELEILRQVSTCAEAWKKIPSSDYAGIGEIIIGVFDKPPFCCSPSTDPNSIRADLAEELGRKWRCKLSGENVILQQSELLVSADAIFTAMQVRGWLRRDPIAVGRAFVARKYLTSAFAHGAILESRTMLHWQGKRARRRGGEVTNAPFSAIKKRSRILACEFLAVDPAPTLDGIAGRVVSALAKEGYGHAKRESVCEWIHDLNQWKKGRPRKK